MIDDFDHGITAIDTGFFRPRFDASHLIVERGRAAFVDVGTNYSIPLLLDVLKQKGLDVDAVDFEERHLYLAPTWSLGVAPTGSLGDADSAASSGTPRYASITAGLAWISFGSPFAIVTP